MRCTVLIEFEYDDEDEDMSALQIEKGAHVWAKKYAIDKDMTVIHIEAASGDMKASFGVGL